jgi:hypothetical protein
MAKMREFMESGAGRGLAAAVLLAAGVAVFFSVRANFGSSSAGDLSRERTFICAQTHKPFEYTLKVGDQIPVKSPHSGKNTGYPAELCYWTKDGRIKDTPTPVLLRSNLGERGPTFCPDCGRLVVGHNPRPGPGDKPPPTESEYKPRAARERE